MCDEHDHKSLVAKLGDEIAEFLPESIRNDERRMYSLGRLCGFAAGWVIGKRVVELFFPPRSDK